MGAERKKCVLVECSLWRPWMAPLALFLHISPLSQRYSTPGLQVVPRVRAILMGICESLPHLFGFDCTSCSLELESRSPASLADSNIPLASILQLSSTPYGEPSTQSSRVCLTTGAQPAPTSQDSLLYPASCSTNWACTCSLHHNLPSHWACCIVAP